MLFAAPRVINASDAVDFFVGQFSVSTVHHNAELARVNEKHFATPIAEAMILFVAGEEPEAGGNGRRIKELARKRNHAVHEVGFDDVLSNFTFAGLV